MRKAFDANVPKLKPRLRGAVPGEQGAGPAVAPAASPPAVLLAPPPAAGETHAATRSPIASAARPPANAAPAGARVERSASSPVPTDPAAGPLFDVVGRRDRLEKIKRKVAAAARAPARLDAPAEPARAGESALALVKDLEARLARSREMEDSLRADLSQAREELARAAAESRGVGERLGAAEKALEEKQAVLGEMLPEMSALEEERDEALRRAQALAALDEERQRLLDEVGRRAEESEKALAEAQAEGERLSAELDGRAADEARLRSGLAEVTRERDALARELAETRAERDKLAEARRALEQVHQALSQARARHG